MARGRSSSSSSKSRSHKSSSRSSSSTSGKRHLRGGGAKEQRMYEHIKRSAQRSGRYGKRAREVAARTVMKYHGKKGHSKKE